MCNLNYFFITIELKYWTLPFILCYVRHTILAFMILKRRCNKINGFKLYMDCLQCKMLYIFNVPSCPPIIGSETVRDFVFQI